MENGISLRMVSFCTRIGVRMEQTPTTTIRLKILEPTTLLTASSLLLTSDAVTLTAVSGSDVPYDDRRHLQPFCDTGASFYKEIRTLHQESKADHKKD